VQLLQESTAKIFDKAAALFVPSGTMGNQISIHLHTSPGQEVITEERSHIFNYEMGAMAAISGVLARPVSSPDGILDWDKIRPEISPKIYYRASTGLIALENSHNMAGGTVYTAEQIEEICHHAHSLDLPVHLDGARIFNAAVALDTDVARLTAPCDSLMFCLSKGLGAPVGSMLVGDQAFIERARSTRKMLGGGMRQVGVLAAAGLIALEKMPARLAEDHHHAKLLAELISDIDTLGVNPDLVRTNIIVLDVSRTGYKSMELAALSRERGVLTGIVDRNTMRLLTHMDIAREHVEEAARVFREIIGTGGGK
jgi:threonine aldolase